MKNLLLILVVLIYTSCGNQFDNGKSEKNTLEAFDLGCKDGGSCLPDHSCCIVGKDYNKLIVFDAFDFNNEVIATFDAAGVHVGDAAQTQYGLSLRYEPTFNSYIKLRGTLFDNYYSDFDPLSLNGENARMESWKIPSYTLFDLHCGYKIKLSPKNKLNLRFSVLNLLDAMYISDAQNNDPYNANYQDFDAKSAGVFFGLGRRFNLSATINF